MKTAGLPPVVNQEVWQRELDALRVREKAATRELDAIAAQRRRLPIVEMPDYVLESENGPVRLVDVFDGNSKQLIFRARSSDTLSGSAQKNDKKMEHNVDEMFKKFPPKGE